MSVSTTPPSYRCKDCQNTSIDARNLIVFIDGTSNKPGDKNTNVVKLFSDVASSTTNGTKIDPPPLYLEGIGAHNVDHLPSLSRVRTQVSGWVEMAFARNVGENVKKAYNWLVDTYREGDRIYLFGFSRGAYQVRALASMVHEVGLVRAKADCERAYEHYLSIHPYKLQARSSRTQFKTVFCWSDVRVHFIGAWDTVSSLGLIKKKVHITASASVTNACHFRHALALDELRVKFLPEYFREMNAHHSSIRSPRTAISDVKEVWFAGSHSDVGGGSYRQDPVIAVINGGDDLGPSVGASNVSFEWMRKEAMACGLIFKPNNATWDPRDIDLGTKESMTLRWKILEFLPTLHQVSFSGPGEHKWRFHLCHPRSVIPSQPIHPSIFSADVYTPRATLGNSARNPIVLRRPSGQLDTTVLPDKRTRIVLLESLITHHETTLGSLEKVLFLIDCLDYETPDNGETQTRPRPQWILSDLQLQGFAKYALAVVYYATSEVTVPDDHGSLSGARDSIYMILQSPPEDPEFTRALYVLRFSTKNSRLRRHFIDDNVTRALMVALDRIIQNDSKILFPLVMDSLCSLIADEHLRHGIVDGFRATPDGTGTAQTKISLTLEMKNPAHLMASLKMIACLAEHHPDVCEELKPKLYELAKKERDGVGSAAVKALVAMNEQPEVVTRDAYICNTLGYLGDILPALDVEFESSPATDSADRLPAILEDNSGIINQDFMRKLISISESRKARERTAATLTLLKLRRNPMIRDFCAQNNVLDIFVDQLEQRKASLLAAYALWKYLEHDDLWTPDRYSRAALFLVSMVRNNWFDDAIGRVEGCVIFRGLMTSVDLRREVTKLDIVPTLVTLLAGGERHQTRMSLVCLDILDTEESPLDLKRHVEDSIADLGNKSKDVRRKGVKVISALGQTAAGERAIKDCVKKVIEMLPRDSSDISRSQIVGAPAIVYNLAKNETLREYIKDSPEFNSWRVHHNNIYHPQR